MSTIGTFFLAFFAFVGTMMLISDPTQKLIGWSRGKTSSQIEEDTKAWFEENGVGKAISLGCGFALFLIVSILYTFVVEPIAVLNAVTHKIGNQPLAYAMLAIVAYSWVKSAWGLKNIKKNPGQKVAVITTEEGEKIEGIVMDTVVDLPDPTILMFRRAFFALPTLYLWYLFLIAIGVA